MTAHSLVQGKRTPRSAHTWARQGEPRPRSFSVLFHQVSLSSCQLGSRRLDAVLRSNVKTLLLGYPCMVATRWSSNRYEVLTVTPAPGSDCKSQSPASFWEWAVIGLGVYKVLMLLSSCQETRWYSNLDLKQQASGLCFSLSCCGISMPREKQVRFGLGKRDTIRESSNTTISPLTELIRDNFDLKNVLIRSL